MPRGSGGSPSSHGGGSSRMHSSGGGRSSRGYSGGSGYSRSGRGAGYSRSGGSSGYGSGRSARRVGYVPPPPVVGGRYYGRRRYGTPFFRVGCVPWAVTVVIFLTVMLIAGVNSCGSRSEEPAPGSEISQSTMEREKISGTKSVGVWYEEHTSERWIHNTSTLKDGLQYFYSKTGVQPYVVITESVPGVTGTPTDTEFTDYLRGVYDGVMPDGGHIVVGVYSDEYTDDYGIGCYAGSAAEAVMDPEAQDILIDYLEYYYEREDYGNEEFLSAAFRDTADKIMTVDKVKRSATAKIVVAVCAVVLVAVVLAFILRYRKLKAREAAENARILESDIDAPDDPLKEKYGVDDDVPR